MNRIASEVRPLASLDILSRQGLVDLTFDRVSIRSRIRGPVWVFYPGPKEPAAPDLDSSDTPFSCTGGGGVRTLQDLACTPDPRPVCTEPHEDGPVWSSCVRPAILLAQTLRVNQSLTASRQQ